MSESVDSVRSDRKRRLGNDLSPMVTAQDRKRMILERRKQRQHLAVVQESMSLSSGLSRPTNKRSSSRSQLSFQTDGSSDQSDGLIRRRSLFSLQESPTMTRLFHHQDDSTQSTAPTRLFINQEADSQWRSFSEGSKATTTATATRKSKGPAVFEKHGSLFGAVMGNVATPKANKQPIRAIGPPVHLTPNEKKSPSPSARRLLNLLSNVTSPYAGRTTPEESEPSPGPVARKEWYETDLGTILDWNLHDKVSLQCHPTQCLPGAKYNPEWEKALQYWEYSATQEEKLPRGKSAARATQKKANSSLEPADLANQLISAVRGPKAWVQNLVHSSNGWTGLRNRRDFQEAFLSLSTTWLRTMGDEFNERSYFYSTTSDHVVLFRAIKQDGKIVPLIILSSVPIPIQEKLRTMEVKLYSLESDDLVFDDSTNSEAARGRKVEQQESSDEEDDWTRTQIQALRTLESAGADVTIKQKETKKKVSVSQPKTSLSVYLKGQADCRIFLEVYLNVVNTATLATRCGPFRNATLKHLTTTKRRMGRLDLAGCVFPCAVSDILSACAHEMLRQISSVRLERNHPKNAAIHASPASLEAFGAQVSDIVWDESHPGTVRYKPTLSGISSRTM